MGLAEPLRSRCLMLPERAGIGAAGRAQSRPAKLQMGLASQDSARPTGGREGRLPTHQGGSSALGCVG